MMSLWNTKIWEISCWQSWKMREVSDWETLQKPTGKMWIDKRNILHIWSIIRQHAALMQFPVLSFSSLKSRPVHAMMLHRLQQRGCSLLWNEKSISTPPWAAKSILLSCLHPNFSQSLFFSLPGAQWWTDVALNHSPFSTSPAWGDVGRNLRIY